MSWGHVFLVGFMGAGKSTVGRLLADKRAMPFVDLDELIEAEANASIASIFAESGEDGFRALESAALARLESAPPSVVACGGGIVLDPRNRALLKELGTVVHLEVSAGEAVARIGDAETRPLLSGTGGTLAATTLLSARRSLYRSVADVTVDTEGRSVEEVAEAVDGVLPTEEMR